MPARLWNRFSLSGRRPHAEGCSKPERGALPAKNGAKGGDYIPVEPVLGHATIARRGIALALTERVEEGWLRQADAMDLIDPIMHANARQIFNLAEKTRMLQNVPWV